VKWLYDRDIISEQFGQASAKFIEIVDGDTAKFEIDGKVESVRFLLVTRNPDRARCEEYNVLSTNYHVIRECGIRQKML
jgi:hypothetical protein